MNGKESRKAWFAQTGFKVLFTFILILLFLIPIGFIKSLIRDRKIYQEEAVASIIGPLGGKPEIQGILIAVPFNFHSTTTDTDGKEHTKTITKHVYFSPDLYSLDIRVDPYYLNRGIFKVPVFNSEVSLQSSFESFDISHLKIDEKDFIRDEAILMVGFSNTKTLTEIPTLKANNENLSISPTKQDSLSPFKSTVFYSLPKGLLNNSLSLSGSFKIQGGEKINIQPIASNNKISMNSTWANPGFSGGWLPTNREIDESGFSANWNITGLSTVFPKSWTSDSKYKGESITVSFITPVDTYQKATRSVKYALLFLIIPFLAIFICEIFSKISVHLIQYSLIGFANVIFYLLLLSISEHLSFNISYIIGAFAVSLSTLFYAASIFKKIKWGLLLSGVQVISYIFLYGTLQAEDYALLIGSIGLFSIVVLLMFITRKIDWYEIRGK